MAVLRHRKLGGRVRANRGIIEVNVPFYTAAALVDQIVWQNILQPVRLVKIQEIHSGAASTADCKPKRCQGTEVPASGDLLVVGQIALTGTINTLQDVALATTVLPGGLDFAAGDRLALDVTGTTTGYIGLFCFTFVPVPEIHAWVIQ